jgi:two-component system, OmpR family, response regulator ResD
MMKQESELILVVEDEHIVSDVVARYLRREGFRVTVAADGASALASAAADQPRLVVLDLMLPDMDGLEVCRRLRAQGAVPILILTAKGSETDEVLGLGLGADDYLSKPLRPSVLVARVKALLRRAAPLSDASGSAVLTYDGLEINPRTRRVTRDGLTLILTAKEFDLLHFLTRHVGTVFSRQQLLHRVWDYTYNGESSTVTVHVRRLREKIEPDPLHPHYIKTVWGVGYKLEPTQ